MKSILEVMPANNTCSEGKGVGRVGRGQEVGKEGEKAASYLSPRRVSCSLLEEIGITSQIHRISSFWS